MGRREIARPMGAAILVAALMATALAPPARAVFPTLPLADDGGFVAGLTAPVLAPGDGGSIDLQIADPLSADLSAAVLTLQVYAFNAYPGNATGPVPSGALSLSYQGSQGGELTIDLGTVVPGAAVPLTIGVSTSSSAPSGTYAIRLVLGFTANGTGYQLASRGDFTEAQWVAATSGPNGTSTLNLSALGVSGVIPETAVLVRSNPFPTALAVILGASLVLAAAGGYYAFRRGPGSSSGATTPEEPSQAPSALGKRRTRDGD